jgi:hypothetical protein
MATTASQAKPASMAAPKRRNLPTKPARGGTPTSDIRKTTSPPPPPASIARTPAKSHSFLPKLVLVPRPCRQSCILVGYYLTVNLQTFSAANALPEASLVPVVILAT